MSKLFVCSYQSIGSYILNSTEEEELENRGVVSTPRAISLRECVLPFRFDNIKKVLCSSNQVRVLTQEGFLYKLIFDLGITRVLEEGEIDTGDVIVKDMSAFTYGVLYLTSDRLHQQTSLFGGCKNFYNNLGRENEGLKANYEDFRHLFTPPAGRTITHIGSAFSFSVCVIDREEVHVSGQNTMKKRTWDEVYHRSDKPIRDLVCGGFTIALLQQDFSIVLFTDVGNETLTRHLSTGFDKVFGGYDRLILRSQSSIPSLEQYSMYSNESVTPLSSHFSPDNWVRTCKWSEVVLNYAKDILLLSFPHERSNIFYFKSTTENDASKLVDLNTYFSSNQNVQCSFNNHCIVFYPSGKSCQFFHQRLKHHCESGKLNDMAIRLQA